MGIAGLTSISIATERLLGLAGTKDRNPVQETVQAHCSLERDIALVINIASQIICCSPAAVELFGRRLNDLLDNAVTALIPDLPFSPETPGYNMAYAAYYGIVNGPWIRHTALLASGLKIPVDILFSNIMNTGNSLIILTLKPVVNQLEHSQRFQHKPINKSPQFYYSRINSA